jgi:hypothetical protein
MRIEESVKMKKTEKGKTKRMREEEWQDLWKILKKKKTLRNLKLVKSRNKLLNKLKRKDLSRKREIGRTKMESQMKIIDMMTTMNMVFLTLEMKGVRVVEIIDLIVPSLMKEI